MLDVLIIGAGPAGLFAAEHLSARGHSVLVADQMTSPARKFLMAGRGGLNLTHSEDYATFLPRYREAASFLSPIIEAFPPAELREWCHSLGQDTFIGTSGRVFPRSMKASPLLRAWLQRLGEQGVRLQLRTRFCGFSNERKPLLSANGAAPAPIEARKVLLAMGGASWPKLGSDATWTDALQSRGIELSSFRPSNCGFLIEWSPRLKERFAGSPLKRISLSLGASNAQGEAVISEQGIEGGAVYALSAPLREEIERHGEASLAIDLRPDLSVAAICDRLERPRGKQSRSTFLRKVLKLAPLEIALLHETGPLPENAAELANRIKAVSLNVKAAYPIDRAISSAGGIRLSELDETLMLRKLPGVYAAGEMIDWEAPTGGYLLQGCFATGLAAATGIAQALAQDGDLPRS